MNNTNRDLLEGLVRLLRDEVDGWSINQEHGVENVWTKSTPQSVNNEFPRGAVDVISGTDTDLSIETNIRFREVIVRIVAFDTTSGTVENLIEDIESVVSKFSDEYVGEWSFREIDGFTELSEDGGREREGSTDGHMVYNRSVDFVFETVKQD